MSLKIPPLSELPYLPLNRRDIRATFRPRDLILEYMSGANKVQMGGVDDSVYYLSLPGRAEIRGN
jgi:hypothetical protein